MLGPDEQFTQLSLSGGKPKKGNMIRSIALLLGPDFASDIIIVETGKTTVQKNSFSSVRLVKVRWLCKCNKKGFS